MRNMFRRIRLRHVVAIIVISTISVTYGLVFGANALNDSVGYIISLIVGLVIGLTTGVVMMILAFRETYQTSLQLKKALLARLTDLGLDEKAVFARSTRENVDEMVTITRYKGRRLTHFTVVVIETDSSDTWLTGKMIQTSRTYAIGRWILVRVYLTIHECDKDGVTLRSLGSFTEKPVPRKKVDTIDLNIADMTDLNTLSTLIANLDTYKEVHPDY